VDNLFLSELLKKWGVDFRKVRADLPLSGSPERSLRRFAIEDKEGRLFVCALIAPDQRARREEMGAVLDVLKQRGLDNIQTYLPASDNARIVVANGDIYQLSRYVAGMELPRPDYIFAEWRGAALGQFLVNLKENSSSGLPLTNGGPFSIFSFIDAMSRKMEELNPETLSAVEDIIYFLNNNFRNIHDRTPLFFCHGDFHPLNVIWSNDGIAAVIDWEFMGIKPEFYDVANLLGCVGVENPNGLVGGLTNHFLATLDRAGFLFPESRRHLPEAVLALRFAWLSVWLSKKDSEMIDVEIHYLRLLYNNLADLEYSWGCENY
jgi:homoserine kinase type II